MKQIEDVINQMKLINKTTPQAKNYQCDKCKSIYCHNKIWYVCRKEVSKNEFKDTSKKGKKEEMKSKEDYWKCKCGRYHKGFPYKCPLSQHKKEIAINRLEVYNEMNDLVKKKDKAIQTLKAEKEEIFKEIEDKFKEPKLYDGWIYDYYIKSISSEDWEKLIQKYTKEE